jgi:predicted acetyltransferase
MLTNKMDIGSGDSLMKDDNLALVAPGDEHRAEFLAMMDEFLAAGEDRFSDLRQAAAEDWPTLVRDWQSAAVELGPSDGWPVELHLLMREKSALVGFGFLGPDLPVERQLRTGNVGYLVRPSQRRKGYATTMLGLLLDEARARGLERVMLVCDAGSPSARVIANHSGVLDSQYTAGTPSHGHDRYWIGLPRRGQTSRNG